MRGRLDVAALDDTDEVVVAAVVVAECLTGTLLDGDPGRTAITPRCRPTPVATATLVESTT